MKSIYLKLIFLSLFTFHALTIFAYGTCVVDGIKYFLLDNNEAMVNRRSDDYAGSIKIPSRFTYNDQTYRVTGIRDGAFYWCQKLDSVIIPNSVTTIGSDAFFGCKSLTYVYIPKSVKTIEEGAFSSCKGLISIEIPSSVKKIGREAFYGCTALTSINIPSSVDTIERGAFAYCSGLTSINIHASAKLIGNGAFQGCSALTSIDIPEGVVTIGESAFAHCQGLTTVSIPSSVTNIEVGAFSNCGSLRKIYCYAMNPPNSRSSLVTRYNAVALYVPAGSVEQYKTATEWNKFQIYKNLFLTAKRDFYGETTNEKSMKGVTADGVSQLYVIFPTMGEDVSKKLRVVARVNGQECTDKAIIGTLGDMQKVPLGWGMTYTAPEDFPDSVMGNAYDIDVEFTTEENGLVAIVGGTVITVYRPGVLLLHGLGSNAGDCFGYLWSRLTTMGGYQPFQVVNGDYRSSNTATFNANTFDYEIVKNRLEELCNNLHDRGIVSSKYDLVGHSMGGILSRLYAQEVNLDGVNKIITLNTPHSGSQLGTIFGEVVTDLKDLGLFASVPLIRTLNHLRRAYYNTKKNNAVVDLSPNSHALKGLNDQEKTKRLKVPVHAIGSYLEGSEREKTNYVVTRNHFFTPVECAAHVCSFLKGDVYYYKTMEEYRAVGHNVLNGIFNNDKHDGIVPLISQMGGLSGTHVSTFKAPYEGLLGTASKAHHTNVHHWDEVCDTINFLLHQPKSSSCFSLEGFNPVDLSASKNSESFRRAMASPRFTEPSNTSYIKIEAVNEDGRMLRLQVHQSDDVIRNLIFAVSDDGQLILDYDTLETRFLIPDIFEGELVVCALGRTRDNALLADTVAVTYTNTSSLSYLFFQDCPRIGMKVGQQMEPYVLSGWSNGDEWYLVPEYTTNREDVLKIDGSVVTAIAEGECYLYGSYHELVDSLSVMVYSDVSTDIERLEVDWPSTKFAHGKLLVSCGQNYSGVVYVDVYDLAGNVCCQRLSYVPFSRDSVEFDLSTLPSRYYIVKIGTSQGVKTMKYYIK